MTHPTSRIQNDVHQPIRLGILAILNGVTRADFRFLKDSLGTTDGNLGRHIQVLEEAGLVEVTKVFEDRKPRTWLSTTRQGREAFRAEVAALRELLDSVERGSSPLGPQTLGGDASP